MKKILSEAVSACVVSHVSSMYRRLDIFYDY
jgi:hypothetical protein